MVRQSGRGGNLADNHSAGDQMSEERPQAADDSKHTSDSGARFLATLKDRITRSILPGEDPLEGETLDEAAAFLLEAAMHRDDGKPAILIRSAMGDKRATRIAVINRDVPFLVDSIGATIADHGLTVDLLVHPVVPVRRDAAWDLTDLPEGEGKGEKRESMIYIETDRIDARSRRMLEDLLTATVADVRAAVADWPEMQGAILRDADHLADAEGAALLRWLGEGMLTQIGHVTNYRDDRTTQCLGICRSSATRLISEAAMQAAFDWFEGKSGKPGRAPLIIKSNASSRVHRRVPLDLFIVPVYEQGELAALSVHAGLWTSAALTTPPDDVPLLRQQLAEIMERFGVKPGGHDHKTLIHAMSVLPHDLVIGFGAEDAARVAAAMMALADKPRPRVEVVTAPLQRHAFAFVWLSRDMVSTATRHRIQGLLEDGTGATTLDWSLLVEGGTLAMLRFVLDMRGVYGTVDPGQLDRDLQAMLRGWADAVEAALVDTGEEPGRAAMLAARHAPGFPPFYRSTYGPVEAATDIERLRNLAQGDPSRPMGRDVRLYHRDGDPQERLRLKVYQHEGSLPLSDAVPALENFGFTVLEEIPTALAVDDAAIQGGTIHDFTLATPAGASAGELLDRSDEIADAIAAVLNQNAENDVFNRLVVAAELTAGEAVWLRAFYRYLRQANIAFTIYTVVDALAGAPEVTRALAELFRTRHEPAFIGDRKAASDAARGKISDGLAGVQAINDDRLLRLYWKVAESVLRTNAFAPAGVDALAMKIDSSMVPGLPKPVPWREIFVYSRRVEGVHLRAGPVARGGIRWSDRRDDFRTEVLGLMKAQRVKNAVIVPTGAKGGFYPKQLPNPAQDRDAWFTEGKESYKLYIRTLLSITDNIVDGAVVHPDAVVVHDGEDPYFVVAADKGTASFSDTANAIALDHGFWLGDAFASGGSNGYDHKAMGITARGAWVSVQRHFLEMGVDVQNDVVRVVGCGDMSGDVFGNGMLLSKSLKLVAAYDHRHIFIDPDPDPVRSWDERKRLFELPRSSWDDYDKALISKGGGVFTRTTKQIELSPEARAALGVEDETLDPDSLISAILKSPADLLWFGGSGTYIKASDETNAEVGDPGNDALRVDATEVRVKVIGEGANLGVTQAGRIEFALDGAGGAGGRLNTDFIDNSAGVDCSDNEVNIKIALAEPVRSGALEYDARNTLLEEMTEEVAALVLEDNRLQALALSIAERGGADAVGAMVQLIETLEEMGDLDRTTEGLADNETLMRRSVEGKGLTRPELAVLLSSAKLQLQDALEASPLAQDEAAVPLLLGDFPEPLVARFRQPILDHRLRNEIVGTVVANAIVNRMGMLHPYELAREEGVGLGLVGCAFVAAVNLLGLEELWEAAESAAMPEAARLALFDQGALALRGHMADLIRASGGDFMPSTLQEQIGAAVAQIDSQGEALFGAEARAHSDQITGELTALGAPEGLARKVARLFALDGTIGVARLSAATGIKPAVLARAFVSLGSSLGLDWAQSRAAVMNPSDPWERLLVAGLARDFQQMRLDFLGQIAGRIEGADDEGAQLESLVSGWAERQSRAIERFRDTIRRARNVPTTSAAMLAQIAGQARSILAADPA